MRTSYKTADSMAQAGKDEDGASPENKEGFKEG